MDVRSSSRRNGERTRLLLIGLGGWGREVLAYIYARLTRVAGGIPDHLRLIGIDVDSRSGESLPSGEQFMLAEVPLERLRREARRRDCPPLHRWFDADAVRSMSLALGTGASRQLGRLAFLWHAGAEEGSLNLREQLPRRLRYFLNQPGPLHIYVLTSLGGGFGSGVFLDVAFWLRDVLGSQITRLVAFLITPTFFSSLPQEPLRANAWAALQELDYFMQRGTARRGEPRFEYFGKRTISTERSPYDGVFFIDAVDAEGRNIAHPYLAVRLVGEILLAMDNLPEEIREKVEQEYNAVGYASLLVPIEEIIQFAALDLLEETVAQWLRAAEGVTTSVEAQLSLDEMIRRIRSGMESRCSLWLHEPDFTAVLEERAAAERTAFSEELQEQLRRDCLSIFREGQSLYGVLASLQQIERQLVASREEGERYGRSLQEQIEKLRENLRRSEEQYLTSPKDHPLGVLAQIRRGGIPYEAATKCLELRKQFVGALEENIALQQSLSLIDDIEGTVRELRKRVERLQGHLQSILSSLQDQRNEVRRQLTSLPDARAFPMLKDEDDIRSRYQGPEGKHWERARLQFAEMAVERFLDWGAQEDGETLFQKLYGTARDAWNHLYGAEELYIEGFLRQNPMGWWEVLDKSAQPFWSTAVVEAAVKGQQVQPIIVVEVARSGQSALIRERPIFAQGENIHVVDGEDPFRVRMVKVIRGIQPSTFALRGQFMEAYQRAMTRYEPVHVFPEFYLGDEASGHERREILARAWAYQWIQRKEEEFFLRRPNGTLEPLGVSDLLDLHWKIVNDDGFFAVVRDAVWRWEQQRERGEILQALNAFQPTPHPGHADDKEWLWAILRDGAQRFAERLSGK